MSSETSFFRTRELNIKASRRCAAAVCPMRGSRLSGVWSRAMVTRPGSADVYRQNPFEGFIDSLTKNRTLSNGIQNCSICLFQQRSGLGEEQQIVAGFEC